MLNIWNDKLQKRTICDVCNEDVSELVNKAYFILHHKVDWKEKDHLWLIFTYESGVTY